MIEFAQIRAFVAVADELHFGRAAKRLNMTQPPLSRHIQLLEQSLDVMLLERTSRSVELTMAGRAFLGEARALLQQRENAIKAAREAGALAGGSVKIGFVGATTYGYLPWLASRLRTELPQVETDFVEMTSREQLDALKSGQIDLGLVRPLKTVDSVRSACVFREELALALPLEHALAARRRPELEQLDGQPFIMYSTAGPYMNSLLTMAFAAAGIRPNVVQSMSQAQSILALVSTGLGLAIVPGETRNACFDNVVFRPIRLGAAVFAELHAIWRNDNRNPVLPRLRELAFRNEN
ncbi:LysR family transcriptional regulator [Bradyrhizobium sp. KB893862 SZCCT0404]|uniref:LysR family transcriptional regulator n=1 Tax=Bradyrhizobium sp. KB893862 SZCCT0404 TaxID=2807672 RepID=UPI001BACB632|nr:LysR family transcriptional regulator [Bradyrhizobium sp. KB893862 SZCCT0404]MBR1175212.1 LysR family transcriptional regulator [Bradyrhizobium sp. KB893862 SZCCT0404]